MTTKDILIEGRKRIESGWCKGCMAVDKNGKEVEPHSSKAVKWCALGAIVATRQKTHLVVVAEERLKKHLPRGFKYIAKYNDSLKRGKAPILRLYDKAIGELE